MLSHKRKGWHGLSDELAAFVVAELVAVHVLEVVLRDGRDVVGELVGIAEALQPLQTHDAIDGRWRGEPVVGQRALGQVSHSCIL